MTCTRTALPYFTHWIGDCVFWNVRTLKEYGKLKQVGKEMTNYKLDIMGLSETGWKESGEIKTQNGNLQIL